MIKLLVLGDSGVGKTSLVHALFNEPTRQDEFLFKNDQNVSRSLKIWETSRKMEEDTSLQYNFDTATGILLLFSLEDLSSFQHLEDWISEIKQHCSRKVPIILIGNKSDLQDKRVSWRDIEPFTRKHNLSYFQASCYGELNHEMILSTIANEMKITTDNNLEFEDKPWLSEIQRIEMRFNQELLNMRAEVDELKRGQTKEMPNRLGMLERNFSENYEESTKNSRSQKILISKVEDLSKKVEKNDDKINEMLIFFEKELKLSQMNLMEEVNQKLKEVGETSVLIAQDKQLMEAEFSNMIKDLNESIRKCIVDTDNFYKNLREEVGTKKLEFESQFLKMEDPQAKSCLYPSEQTHPLFRNANLSMDDAQSGSSVEEFRVDNESPLGGNDQENRPINLSTHHSSGFKKQNTGGNFVNPEKLQRDDESQKIENYLKEELDKVWEALRSFTQETRDEIEKIHSEHETSMRLNRMYNDIVNKQLPLEIEEYLGKATENLRYDFNNRITEIENESNQAFSNLKKMIISTREEILERFEPKKELQQNFELIEEENNNRNRIATFLNPIEPITSEIRPGWTSPNEDLSLTELRIFEKKTVIEEVSSDDLRNRVASIERQQEEIISSSNEINRNIWGTVSLVAERVHRLELRAGVK